MDCETKKTRFCSVPAEPLSESGAEDKPFAYIGGPMRGVPDFNFSAFDAAKSRLEAAGYRVISPADLDRVMHLRADRLNRATGTFEGDPTNIILRDVVALCSLDPARGDVMALLPGFENSTGARAEIAICQWRGVPFIHAETLCPLLPSFQVGIVPSDDVEGFPSSSEPDFEVGDIVYVDAEFVPGLNWGARGFGRVVELPESSPHWAVLEPLIEWNIFDQASGEYLEPLRKKDRWLFRRGTFTKWNPLDGFCVRFPHFPCNVASGYVSHTNMRGSLRVRKASIPYPTPDGQFQLAVWPEPRIAQSEADAWKEGSSTTGWYVLPLWQVLSNLGVKKEGRTQD